MGRKGEEDGQRGREGGGGGITVSTTYHCQQSLARAWGTKHQHAFPWAPNALHTTTKQHMWWGAR